MAVLENVVLLQNGGYREAPEQLAPTELPQQWRRPRQAMAPELVMDLDWRMVADGRPDNPLPCRLYDTRKRARTESEQREATAKLGRSLQEFNISKSFVESLLEATTCTYVDTQFGRAPRGSAMEVQLALHPSSYKTLVSLESCERGRLAAPTPLCLFGGVDQWSPGPDDDVEFLEDLMLTAEGARNLERDTRQQANSPLWREARLNRLTASKFSLVLKRVHPWTYAGLRNIFRPKPFTSASVRYGTSKEGDAVRRYVEVVKKLGHDVVIYNCGIMVGDSPEHVGTRFRSVETRKKVAEGSILNSPSGARETSNGRWYNRWPEEIRDTESGMELGNWEVLTSVIVRGRTRKRTTENSKEADARIALKEAVEFVGSRWPPSGRRPDTGACGLVGRLHDEGELSAPLVSECLDKTSLEDIGDVGGRHLEPPPPPRLPNSLSAHDA
ncbi:hypothetical protein HPB47_004146, partial [Ixodes persulcatus]